MSRNFVIVSVVLLGAACAGSAVLVVAGEDRWQFTDPDAWTWSPDAEGVWRLELEKASSYEPPHRSPHSLAILRDAEFEDFDLGVEVLSTSREYPHRDLVIVFAYRDASHYAYAHLATAADPTAHHVMLVDGAPRRPVTIERTGGVEWDGDWHDLRLTRRGEAVEVFFDGQRVITAEVPVGPGRVGLGSFDDTGVFRRLVVTPR